MANQSLVPGSKGASVLRQFILVSTVAVIGLSVAAAQRYLARRHVVATWAATTATVRRCALYETHTISIHGGVSLSIHCTLNYAVDGRVVSGTAVSTALSTGASMGHVLRFGSHGPAITSPYDELTTWLREHRVGSRLQLHIDPEHPQQASFIGLGEPVDIDPTPESLAGVMAFVLLGLAARWAADRLDARVANVSDARASG